tara:strand:- start:250 stop:369 length:120 start_codon:yes stop_codon:yes gene_type:complete
MSDVRAARFGESIGNVLWAIISQEIGMQRGYLMRVIVGE